MNSPLANLPLIEGRRARRASAGSPLVLACLAAVLGLGLAAAAAAETWRGLTVAPEHRCSSYDKKRDYPYPQSVERDIVRELGAVYGPYTGTCFVATTESDIEHIVAASEAHDSGLCAADAATKARFARDLRNLTLASPAVNRHEKSDKDAAEWVPARNRCWFAGRVLEVRRTYGLTIDRREAAALDGILTACESTALEPVVCPVPSASASDSGGGNAAGGDALALYDDNRNGSITCAEARRHAGTGLPRSRGRTRRTATCGMGRGMALSVNSHREGARPVLLRALSRWSVLSPLRYADALAWLDAPPLGAALRRTHESAVRPPTLRQVL